MNGVTRTFKYLSLLGNFNFVTVLGFEFKAELIVQLVSNSVFGLAIQILLTEYFRR